MFAFKSQWAAYFIHTQGHSVYQIPEFTIPWVGIQEVPRNQAIFKYELHLASGQAGSVCGTGAVQMLWVPVCSLLPVCVRG